MRYCNLPVNIIHLTQDISLGFQHHALWREMHAVPLRHARMANGASFRDQLNRSDMQFGAGSKLIFGIGVRIMFRRTRMAQQHGHHCECASGNPDPPGGGITLVFCIEEMPDQRADDKHQRKDDPGVGCCKDSWIMPTDHDENHRQGQIVIMQGSLLAAGPMARVGRVTGNQRIHHLALAGDDDHGNIRHHDRANGNTDLHEGTACRKDLRIAPRQQDDEHKSRECQRHIIAAQRAAAHQIIGNPTAENAGKAERNRLPWLQIQNLCVDHIKTGLRVIDNRQQRKA